MTDSEIKPRHLVFGTGLIGSFLAGSLPHAGYAVTVVGRASFLEGVSSGFRLTDLDAGDWSVPAPNAALEPGQPWEGDAFDCVWVTLKAPSIQGALQQIGEYIGENTLIIGCQNGFGSELILQRAFPNNQVLSAILSFNVARPETSVFHRSTDGWLVVESHPSVEQLAGGLSTLG